MKPANHIPGMPVLILVIRFNQNRFQAVGKSMLAASFFLDIYHTFLKSKQFVAVEKDMYER
jgi:hypothetical protein